MKINGKILDYYKQRKAAGKRTFVCCGGRRSGKTYTICQILLLRCYHTKRIANVASMTQTQGRLGAYADCVDIINAEPALAAVFEVLQSPREIRNRYNGSRIFFNSYRNSETAKGVACDYLYINEANNFTKQQYTDLLANVRRGVFLDYNPNTKFWVDDYFAPEDICKSTWRDNPFLSPLQLEYFADLKRLALDVPNPNPVDVRNYKVYYLGEYAELSGKIFNRDNIKRVETLPKGLRNFCVFCDPSALRGADFFACVLSASDKDGNCYILDVHSVNDGTREAVVRHLLYWCTQWDVETVYIETNGIVGIDFFEFAQNSELPVQGWYSRGNKFDRIVGNFQNLTNRVFFAVSPTIDAFLEQVYDFDQKCEHDDNIDAVNSSYNIQALYM